MQFCFATREYAWLVCEHKKKTVKMLVFVSTTEKMYCCKCLMLKPRSLEGSSLSKLCSLAFVLGLFWVTFTS